MTQVHSQLHDQVIVRSTLVEILQSHHIVVFYPKIRQNSVKAFIVMFSMYDILSVPFSCDVYFQLNK